jgi:hypothetical protein
MQDTSNNTNAPTHAEIAALAEKIYRDSGCIPGRDHENWLLAEAQLKGNRSKSLAAEDAESRSPKPARPPGQAKAMGSTETEDVSAPSPSRTSGQRPGAAKPNSAAFAGRERIIRAAEESIKKGNRRVDIDYQQGEAREIPRSRRV